MWSTHKKENRKLLIINYLRFFFVPLTDKILNLKDALRLIIEYLQTTEDIIKLITSI